VPLALPLAGSGLLKRTNSVFDLTTHGQISVKGLNANVFRRATLALLDDRSSWGTPIIVRGFHHPHFANAGPLC
jgi:hypothetical protein